jgi:hypothetical protein
VNRLLVVIYVLFTACAATAPARGAVYRFELQGTVTYSQAPNPAAGEPVVITYFADSHDLSPAPDGGVYTVFETRILFPNLTLTGLDGGGSIVVRQRSSFDSLAFDATIMGPAAYYDLAYLDFLFPAGTLANSSLPLELPLEFANLRRLQVGAPNARILAQITSYRSTSIPEPKGPATICLLLAACGWMRRW